MSYGPVEVLVVKFPGSKFNGDVAPALKEVADRGDIRIIDLVFVAKTEDGDIVEMELRDLAPEEAAALDPVGGEMTPLLNDEDMALVEEGLEPGSSAVVLVFEHLWAARLAGAVAQSQGELVFSERIPAPVVEAALAAAQS
jgi:hypothetical protein